MGRFKPYAAEVLLVLFTMAVGLLGFWDIYFGPRADPQPHHHLHVATTFGWMVLLLVQISYLANGAWSKHRRIGLAILFAGPLLVASAAMLTVHSARSALTAGQDDFLIVQNVLGTVWLALLLVMAFACKRRRQIHGAFLTSTLVAFLGPALFFALIAFAPPFRIQGPETFYRFQTAGLTGMAIALVIALLFFVRGWRNNWPYVLAAASFVLGEVVKPVLGRLDLTDPFTRVVAAPGETAAFVTTFVVMSAFLAVTALPVPGEVAPEKPAAPGL